MKGNLTKRILSNGLAQITIKVVRILDQLLLVPFFLLYWGAAYYGEWMTLSIIPTILSFSDLGVGSAAGNTFVLAYVAGEHQLAANIRKSGLIIISSTIFIGIILTFTVLFVLKERGLLERTIIPENEVVIAVSLLMIAKLLTFYNHLIEGYFRCARKAALAAFMYSGFSMVNILVGLFTLYLGCNVVGFAFGQFIVSILYTFLYFIIGNRMVDLKEYNGCIILSDIKNILTKGLAYMMNPIWQSLYFQGGTLVVRVVLGPESVAIFNTMRTACRSMCQLFNVINGSVLPEMQYEYGKGNILIVHRLFRLSILVSILIGIIGSIFLFFFGLDIYNLWTQNALSASNVVWYTFVIGILFNGVWWTAIIAYSVTNKPYHFAFSSIIAALIAIIVSYLLAECLGLWGAVIGTTLFDLIMMLYILPDCSNILGLKTKEIFQHFKEDYIFDKDKFQFE